LSGAGGAIEVGKDARSDGVPDILRSLAREIKEELGVEFHEVKSNLHSVIYVPASRAIALSFINTTYLTSDEIRERKHDKEAELEFVEVNPDAFEQLILTRTNAISSEILLLLISLGEQKFGKKWSEGVREIFKLRGISLDEAIRRNFINNWNIGSYGISALFVGINVHDTF